MANKTLPLKEISIKELYKSSSKIIYEVPIYQRNYAWEKEEITALIQDTYDAYVSFKKGNGSIYFIGTLVSFHKGDNVYEVIDGQQRLTTINLILHALKIEFENKLTYKARKKSNDTINSVPKFNVDEKDIGIVNGYKYAESALKEIIPNEKDLKGFKDFFRNNVHIIHYQVPKDIDLNHYFEIMNSRGEQLEKHEIIKARLLSILKDDSDKSRFNAIWENCSDMGVYIQYKYRDKSIFGDNLCDFEIRNFSDLPDVDKHQEDYVSLYELINNNAHYDLSKPESSEDKPDSFQPIIDFPNFLLIVLKLTLFNADKNFKPLAFNLDDKELIREFSSVRTVDEEFVKTFGYNLLKAKYLLDNYIVHHSNEDDTIDNNPWKLQYWCQDRSKKMYGYLKNLTGNNKEEDTPLHQKLLQLLSMFEVSFTARQRKNYLFYCLAFLFKQYDGIKAVSEILPVYADFVESLAEKYFNDVYLVQEKLNSINTPMPGSFDETILKDGCLDVNVKKSNLESFATIYGDGKEASRGIPLFVFNYLDYKIWQGYSQNLRSGKYREGSKERNEFFAKLGCSDFSLKVFEQFYFSRTRRSLEHYYPQANVDENGLNEDQINCLGNFAMIGSEANSSGSNWSPKTKLDHYLDASGKIKQISVASLKFMVMMQICKDNQFLRNPGDEWNFEDIVAHQEKMIEFLR